MTSDTPTRAAGGWSAPRTIGLLMMVLATGCAGPDRAPPSAPEPIDARAERSAPTVARAVPPRLPPDLPPDLPPIQPPVVPPALPPSMPQPVAAVPKAAPPVARPGAPTSPPLLARPVVKDAAPVRLPARAAPLDLKSLEERLKATPGIGVFTKLTLKNQVDDLLAQFRAHYRGQGTATLPQLRQSYDRLLLKVLALLQDADPPLAMAIATSRESIWDILSTPAKFAAI